MGKVNRLRGEVEVRVDADSPSPKGRTSKKERAEEEQAWSELWQEKIAPLMREVFQLRVAGVPDEAFRLVDELGPWIRAARALPVLREYEQRLLEFARPPFSEVLSATRKSIEDCEDILGPGWQPATRRDLAHDKRFGDAVVQIYEAIRPHTSSSPSRRTPDKRGRPVRFNAEAARLTARLVNFACANSLGTRMTQGKVFRRVQERMSP